MSWKEKLEGRLPSALEREIDIFETQIELRKKGKIEEKLFAETRLRRGVYGQRYDNGQRHDGEKTQEVKYPAGETKGPSTLWDAPGMMRIKIPMGRLSAEQLEAIAELAEEYSDRILHITTRQDVQLHFVHIEDTPDLMRRLAAVGVTTREACGNTVRNVTTCPFAGVCRDEPFDVSPYAHAVTYFLLGHDDTQDFGRKFKVAFSGCKPNPCGLVTFHDIGCIAVMGTLGGSPNPPATGAPGASPGGAHAPATQNARRGFAFYVGGGLGAVPQAAQLLDPFVTEEELLPLCQAIARIFARHGEKANRQKARMKFLIKKLGFEEFKRLVLEERTKLRPDPRWTAFLADLHRTDEKPLRPPAPLPPEPHPEGFARWARHNVLPQKQPGYAIATITLPLGDLTSDQARLLAAIARKYTGDALRTTAEQNLLLRWVSEGDLPALYQELVAADLAEGGASTITDITACPGTDTCKLGISSSRALAAELRRELAASGAGDNDRMQGLHIKASGCFNSCGQHHVADLGFLGVSRNVNGRRVPHFQLVIGGKWTDNASTYGLAIGAIPSKRVPAFARRITEMYAKDRQNGESFAEFVNRIGKKTIRTMVEETQVIPSHEQDPSYYSDWGDPREYTIDDMGVGECAGEIVPYVQVGLASSEREIFEAQVMLDEGNIEGAGRAAYNAMLEAARALTREKNANLGSEPEEIVREFRTHFYDTQLFFDPYAGGKFAQYFFRAHDEKGRATSKESAHQLIEEAQLFVDAAHQCYSRHGSALGAPTAVTA
jgi:sulfite reductase (ferredoxin)